jgi:hypothetical protein
MTRRYAVYGFFTTADTGGKSISRIAISKW